MIVFDVELHTLLTLLAGVIFPLLVGLATTRLTDPGARAIVLAGLAVLTSLATELASALQREESYNLGGALLTALATFLISVGMHYGLWKPTGVTDKVLDSGKTAALPVTEPYTPEPATELGASEYTPLDRVDGPDHRAE